VVAGLLNKQVGGELEISEFAVKAHRGKVMRKMKTACLAGLVNMTTRLRLAPAPSTCAERVTLHRSFSADLLWSPSLDSLERRSSRRLIQRYRRYHRLIDSPPRFWCDCTVFCVLKRICAARTVFQKGILHGPARESAVDRHSPHHGWPEWDTQQRA